MAVVHLYEVWSVIIGEKPARWLKGSVDFNWHWFSSWIINCWIQGHFLSIDPKIKFSAYFNLHTSWHTVTVDLWPSTSTNFHELASLAKACPSTLKIAFVTNYRYELSHLWADQGLELLQPNKEAAFNNKIVRLCVGIIKENTTTCKLSSVG